VDAEVLAASMYVLHWMKGKYLCALAAIIFIKSKLNPHLKKRACTFLGGGFMLLGGGSSPRPMTPDIFQGKCQELLDDIAGREAQYGT